MVRILFPFLLLLTGCSLSRSSRVKQQIDFQGHRGCRGLMPENTIPAMRTALDLGVTTLEMDVVVSGDSQLVVSHDPFYNHEISTKPDGSRVMAAEEQSLNLFHMTYAEIARYDVGLRPHPRFPQQRKMPAQKPLLSVLIDSIERYSAGKPPPHYNIETKSLPGTDGVFHPGPDAFAERLARCILDKKIEDRVMVQSFDPRTLQYLHQHYPAIPLALLIEETDGRPVEKQLQQLGFVPSVWSPHYSLVTPSAIRFLHQRKVRVIPWTVNEVGEMQRLLQLGVDGLISDYPNLFQAVK